MHFYPFNPAAYLLDTVHLDEEHDLAYRRLLDFYYTAEAPIPRETEPVARRLRLDNLLVLEVLNEFFFESPEGWRQARCDAEIADYHRLAEVRRQNGKSGGRPKKTKQVVLANQDKSSSPPAACNQESGIRNQEVNALHTHRALREGLPDSEDAAKGIAATVGVPPDYAVTIWNEMDGIGWEDSNGRPITNFASYLKARYNHRTEKHAREEKRAAARGGGANGSPRTETVHALQVRIDAARDRIAKINGGSFANPEAAAKAREEREQLQENVTLWKKQILSLPV